MGVLPGRQPAVGAVCPVENGRSHADRVRPRRDRRDRIHSRLCRDRVVCAEYANHHGLRSQGASCRRGARRVAEAAVVSLRHRSGAGLRDSRNPAAQRIHLLQVLMVQPAGKLLRLLGASALILMVAAALNFIVDPLQLFRPARLFPAMYSQDSRMQDAGLIRSQDFDTVFMGTSLAIHFRQSDIDRLLGVRSLKLSMTGSNSREQSFVLAAALERHPRRIVWEIDDWIFHDAPDIDSDVYFPANLLSL